MFCARCGQQIPEGSQACSHCGQPVNWAWQTSPPPPPPPGQPGAAPAFQYSPSQPAVSYAAQGVGGALLFFSIALAILWPLWTLSQYARFHLRLSPLNMIGLLRLAFGVLVGIMLWTRQSAAMVLLRIHLALFALFTAYALVNMLRLMVRYRFSPFTTLQVFLSLGISIVFLVSMIIYFSASERVRATYGSKLFG